MLVKLNCWRDQDGPGDVVDLEEQDAATLIHHGAATAVDGPDGQPADPPNTGRVVTASAVLESAAGTADATP